MLSGQDVIKRIAQMKIHLRSCLGLSKTDSLEALLQRLADDKPENAV